VVQSCWAFDGRKYPILTVKSPTDIHVNASLISPISFGYF